MTMRICCIDPAHGDDKAVLVEAIVHDDGSMVIVGVYESRLPRDIVTLQRGEYYVVGDDETDAKEHRQLR